MIRRLSTELLLDEGKIIIGDVSFSDSKTRTDTRLQVIDFWDDEYYWAFDEFLTKIDRSEFLIEYKQVSKFGGVYVITSI